VAGEHRDKLDAQADSLERLGAERTDPAALDTVARALKLQIGKSGPVQQGTRVQLGPMVIPDAGVWAFQAKRGATSSVIETSYAFYVFRLDSLHEAGVPALAEIRDVVTHSAREQKKWDLARALAKDYMKRLDGGASMADAAKAMKLPYRDFGPFSRIKPPLADPIVVGTAFGLEVGKRSGVLDTKNGIYILESLSHTKADSAAFVKGLEVYRAQAVALARQERVRNYMTALRSAAKIVDNRDKVLQTTAQRGA
jgi:hypothetical protein